MMMKLPMGHRVPNTCQSQGSWWSLRNLGCLALPRHSTSGRPVLSANGSLPLPSASCLFQPLKAGPGSLMLNEIGTYFSA